MKPNIIPIGLTLLGMILAGFSFLMPSGGGGDLDIEIDKASFIMPAAHNVYSNPNALNGKYYLFKAKVTNPTKKQLEDVVVRYRVPGYIDWTELTTIGEMFEGQTASVVCYPKFSDDIAEKMTESMETTEIEISWKGAGKDDIIEEDFAFKMLDRNTYVLTGLPAEEIASWADVYDNDALLACFVTPNDPIVKYYTQIIQEKVLKGDEASVTRKPQDAARFLMGIYEATRMSHMVYSGTKGIPQSLNDVSSFSQHNRLPREVITGNTGLCMELSMLYASILSAAGIDPIIFLVPGHSYPGFKMDNIYYAIEATAIGGEGLGGIGTVEEALSAGEKQLNEFFQKAQSGDPRFTMIDVHALNQQGVTPLALSDDEFSRLKVKEIGDQLSPTVADKAAPKKNPQEKPANNINPGPANNDNPNTVAANRTAGPLSFTIPSGWQVLRKPYPNIPILTLAAVSPDQLVNAMVYDVSANGIDDAMMVISEYLYDMGTELTYSKNGNSLTGFSYSVNGPYKWKGKGTTTSSGVRIVAVGAPESIYNQASGVINSLYQSIR